MPDLSPAIVKPEIDLHSRFKVHKAQRDFQDDRFEFTDESMEKQFQRRKENMSKVSLLAAMIAGRGVVPISAESTVLLPTVLNASAGIHESL